MIFVEVERSMHFWKLERNVETRREATLDRNSFKSLHLRLTFSLPIVENTRWSSSETMENNRRLRFFHTIPIDNKVIGK